MARFAMGKMRVTAVPQVAAPSEFAFHKTRATQTRRFRHYFRPCFKKVPSAV
jgi:hypothetical protein